MKNKKKNYAMIAIIIVAVAIVLIAMIIGVLQMSKIHIDENTPAVMKNITITSKSTTQEGNRVIDSSNTSYLTSERVYIGLKIQKNYTVTVQTINNGTGYWIESYVGIPELNIRKSTNEVKPT
jgi:hypothetical protein